MDAMERAQDHSHQGATASNNPSFPEIQPSSAQEAPSLWQLRPDAITEPVSRQPPIVATRVGGELTQPLRAWTTHSKITIAWHQAEVSGRPTVELTLKPEFAKAG